MTQQQALDILKMGRNVFLTGPAGSGKTYVLNKYIEHARRQGAAPGITASTGIAATHIGGITIHSWSGLGVKERLTRKDLSVLVRKTYLKKRIKNASILIIDEISMLHHFQLDLVDAICQAFKENSRPFGGMQVVLCGDFFQLPPVSKGAPTQFAHQSAVWNNMDLQVCYLEEQYRHTDRQLVTILKDIRANTTGEQTLTVLRQRYCAPTRGRLEVTKLYTHNRDVDAINHQELLKLPGTAKRYTMVTHGKNRVAELLAKGCLAPSALLLKKDAVVMFVKNNFNVGYVNGTLGRVVDFNERQMPVVRTLSGQLIEVAPESWVVEEDGEIVAEVVQLPLRLAWAITVHKSQGMTLDAAEIDLSQSFAPGMGYVALSRVRSLSGLSLVGLNQTALRVNQETLDADSQFQQASVQAGEILKQMDPDSVSQRQKEFSRSVAPPAKKPKVSTYEQTRRLVEQKLPIADIAKKRDVTAGTVIGHLEKLVAKGAAIDLSYLRPPAKIFNKIAAAFAKSGDRQLSPVKELLGNKYTYDDLRLARLFL